MPRIAIKDHESKVAGDVVARVSVMATKDGEQFRFHFSRRAFDDLAESSLWYRPEDLRSLRELIESFERRIAPTPGPASNPSRSM